jgi:small-conductance mechanosensitive channel
MLQMTGYEILQLSIYIASGFVLGFVLYKWLIPVLAKLAAKTKWQSDDLIIHTISKWVIPWLMALGLYLGLTHIEIRPKYQQRLETWLMVFYVLSLTWITARILAGLLKIRASGTGAVIPSSSIIGNIVKVIVYCIGLLFILQSLGISITPILTALGVGGLAVALALQDTLSNLFSGIQLIASGKLNPGDFIKLSSGEQGYIQDINWRSTSIRDLADHIVIVPNSKLATMIVSNFNLPQTEIGFGVEVGVSYDSDLEKVERVTAEVVKETLQAVDGGLKDFVPIIRFYNFGDSSINLRAILRVKGYVDQFLVTHEFIKRLKKRYDQEGINIPFPIRTVYMQKEEE